MNPLCSIGNGDRTHGFFVLPRIVIILVIAGIAARVYRLRIDYGRPNEYTSVRIRALILGAVS